MRYVRYRDGSSRAALVVILAVLVVASGAMWGRAVSPAHAAPYQRQAGSDPTIIWDGSMIFAGQNSGNPWGPVGEHVTVHGQNFADGQYTLALAKGDVNSDATVCSPGNLIPLDVTVTASGGKFDASFDWPAAANQVNVGYSICALNATDGSVASHLDLGPFTVLAANPPHIQLTATTVTPGRSITVSGQNWVPPQSILVYAMPCQACDAPKTASVVVTSQGLNAGTFSTTLTIPAGTPAGTYYVGAISENGVLSATEQPITVAAPSPTATAKPSPTATSVPTAVPTATPSQNAGGANGASGLVIGLAIGIIVLLAALAGLIAYLVTRRRELPRDGRGGLPGYPVGAPGQPPHQAPSPPAPYGVAPPPLPMPDELAWDPGATRAAEQVDAPLSPDEYDAPTEPGLRTPRGPRPHQA